MSRNHSSSSVTGRRPLRVAPARHLNLSLWSGIWWFVAGSLLTTPAASATTLTVDLSSPIGPATHVASGSVYGVTEALPADVSTLIAPLHPKMFTNPAANIQQPVGDAIVVAERLAPTGATVTIRLADWLEGFYTLTTMDDWFGKLEETVSRRKAANLTNIYAYEIWNEPNLTYDTTNPLTFHEFWLETYAELRQLEPDVKITGPSLAWYDEPYLRDFLSFCKTNNCLPDIVGWHELSGGDLTGNLRAYRALEQSLGISPLLISINEYSGSARIDVEGQPGASAPLIAKFERFAVDTACITFWDVPHPGRLGSLLATNTEPNGGWWFYKWYGEMSGNMVSTTPPTPDSPTALDGFANLDEAARSATVLFGGANDGTVQVVVKGLGAASFLGSTVRAIVEHVPFVNRSTVVTSTNTLSTDDIVVEGDQLTVSVPSANATDGYRLSLSPVGEAEGGQGGSTSSGGGRGEGGATSSGGSGEGGLVGKGGTPEQGGREATGGTPSRGGTTYSGGLTGTGGATPTAGGASGGGAAVGPEGDPSGSDDGGCGCRTTSSPSGDLWSALVGLAFFASRRRRAR